MFRAIRGDFDGTLALMSILKREKICRNGEISDGPFEEAARALAAAFAPCSKHGRRCAPR